MAEQPAAPSSLFQQLQQNLSKLSQPVQPAGQILGQTEAIQRVSQAASGKQVPTAGVSAAPARSRQGELQVVDQVRKGQEELAKQAQIQNLALAQEQKSIQDSEQFKNKLLSEEQLNTRDKLLTTQQEILSQYSTGQRQLDLNKDKARMEQLGFGMRLSNDKYLNELEQQAKLANLSDAISFEEETMRAIFADEEELLRDSIDFRALLSADERQFTEEMSKMSRELAVELAKAENKRLSEKQLWDGVSGLMSAGAYGYSQFGKGVTAPEVEPSPGIPNILPDQRVGPPLRGFEPEGPELPRGFYPQNRPR